jgi:dipeptidyl aminopeptidase/acylaminoacyl peptidase
MAVAAAAWAEPHSIAELTRYNEFRAIAMSPDGKRLALGIAPAAGRTDSILVIELDRPDDPAARRIIDVSTPVTETRVRSLQWASDTRLLAGLEYEFKVRPRHLGPERPGDPPYRSDWLYSYDVTGVKPPVSLGTDFLGNGAVETVRGNSPEVIMAASSSMARDLYRVNIDTGALVLLEKADPITYSWRVDDGRAVLKMNRTRGGETTLVFKREAESKKWKLLNTYDFPQDRWFGRQVIRNAVGITEVYSRQTREGADTDGIHVHDYGSKSIVATLMELPDRDIDSILTLGNEFLAANYINEKVIQRFRDPAWQAHYDALRDRFDAETSVQVVTVDRARQRWLVLVTGPRTPGEFHLFTLEDRALRRIATQLPWLERQRLAPASMRSTTTRDGFVVRSTLTCPESGTDGPRALIVIPPADPTVQRSIRFDPVAQTFAAQGWCVLEPDTRGTYGRGRRFQNAGDGEWGGRVAADIADAIGDLVQSGIADGKRVAVVAEGLGAYATLAAALERPGLIRAAVLRSPVVDFKAILQQRRGRFGKTSIVTEEWEQWLGEPPDDSPLLAHADAMEFPVLIVHASDPDPWVPVDQSQALESALTKAGRHPAVLWLPEDTAWDGATRREIHWLTEAVRFLDFQLDP